MTGCINCIIEIFARADTIIIWLYTIDCHITICTISAYGRTWQTGYCTRNTNSIAIIVKIVIGWTHTQPSSSSWHPSTSSLTISSTVCLSNTCLTTIMTLQTSYNSPTKISKSTRAKTLMTTIKCSPTTKQTCLTSSTINTWLTSVKTTYTCSTCIISNPSTTTNIVNKCSSGITICAFCWCLSALSTRR